jgi:hypothetical protein
VTTTPRPTRPKNTQGREDPEPAAAQQQEKSRRGKRLAEKARKLSRGRAENEISFSLVLSGTVICALELLRLGAREGSKKENSGKTCEQREKLSTDQIQNET